MFLHVRIHKVKLEADLGQSIGSIFFSVNDIFARFGFPGRLQSPSTGDMFFVTLSTATSSLACTDKLDGSITSGGFILEGEHHFGDKKAGTKVRVFSHVHSSEFL